MRWIGLFAIVLIACDGDLPATDAHERAEESPRGRWQVEGRSLRLERVHSIPLDSTGPGLVVKLFDENLAFQKGQLYVADALPNSGIQIYDSTGSHLRTIPISARIGGLLVDEDLIIVKDLDGHRLLELAPDGQVRSATTSGVAPRSEPTMTLGGLQLVRDDGEATVYSTIFHPYTGKKYFEESDLVGVYELGGRIVTSFAKHHPKYARQYLTSYFSSHFVVNDDRLLLIEKAAPRIRVFSLDGRLLNTFGVPGSNYRPVVHVFDQSATLEEIGHRFVEASTVDRIGIATVGKHPHPVVVVSYSNYDREFVEINPRNLNFSQTWVVVYDLEGDLLYNDLEAPGRVAGTDADGRLLVHEDHTPTRRRVGLYRLVLE